MSQQPRLELTWIGKDAPRPRLEPRILLEDAEKSCHAAARRSEADIFDNMLIHGDNLLALKALEQDFTGKVKCIYIDPPYNTGSAFEHYDDGLEHSLWLSLMRDRLEILRNLLTEDGSLWVTLDDNEVYYFKIMADEVFGRSNFISSFAWEKDKGRRNDTDISSAHDFILAFAKCKEKWKKIRNPLERTSEQRSRYRNPDNDPRGDWLQGDNGTAKSGSESARFPITLPSGRTVVPPAGNFWRFSKETFEKARSEGRVYFGITGDSMPVIKRYFSEVKSGIVPRTWWTAEEAGTNQSAKRDHLRKLLPEIEPFATPKPEQLLKIILHIATNPGDLVLDSFLGSGTTAAVAHKMGRRWIGIELGEHCYTHCLPRLQKVVHGEDAGGISTAVNWRGGGGFRFYELAPSLIKTDRWGNQIINPRYNAEMLAAALCKLEGFHYAPNADVFWQQGYSSERDFLYVTTQTLDFAQLEALDEEVGPERTLLVCCGAQTAGADELAGLERLTVKKIPQAVLHKCEWDHDDYSLNVACLPQAEPAPADDDGEAQAPAPRKRGRKQAAQQMLLPLPGKGE